MTTNFGGSRPQDHLPHEQPLTPGKMPVIGANGEILHEQPAGSPSVSSAGLVPVSTTPAGSGRHHVAIFGEVKDRQGGALGGAVTFFGNVNQAGPWVASPEMRIVSVFGDVVLDLREATLGAQEVTITAITAFGNVKIIAPPGLDVVVSGLVALGDRRVMTPTPPLPGSPRVKINAVGAFADVKVVELQPGESEHSFWNRLSGRA